MINETFDPGEVKEEGTKAEDTAAGEKEPAAEGAGALVD